MEAKLLSNENLGPSYVNLCSIAQFPGHLPFFMTVVCCAAKNVAKESLKKDLVMRFGGCLIVPLWVFVVVF